jgi:hypothetical protein
MFLYEAEAATPEATEAATTAAEMFPLILKRAPIGWNQEDYDVLEDGVVIGHVFLMPIGLKGRPWMWAIRERKGRTPAHGYEPTREAAMAAFAHVHFLGGSGHKALQV